jgi:hypothetical protein
MVKRIDRGSGRTLGLHSRFDWDVQKLIAKPYLHGTALFDRACLLSLGGYARQLAYYGLGLEDYDLWLKFAQAGCQAAFRAEILSVGCGEEDPLNRVAADRLPALLAHFQHKFSALLARYPAEAMRFGRPVTVKIERLAKGHAARRPHWGSRSMEGLPGPMAVACSKDSENA